MHNLVRVIGPAPSELSKEELISKLALLRRSITFALDDFKNSPPTSAKKKKKSAKAPALVTAAKKLMQDENMSIEDLLKWKAMMMASKKETAK